MKKLLKIVNSLLFVFFICFMVYMLVSSFSTLKLTKLLIILCILPLIMVPYLLDRIKLYHMDEVIIFFYYLFLLLSLVFGSVLDFYYKIWWFDLFTHFISGIFSAIIAFILLQENKIIKKDNKIFCVIFIMMFAIGIAACWEYFEFCCDKIFGGDAQWVKLTGVDDTMTDMLIATLGGVFVSIYYVYYIHKKNSGGSIYEKGKSKN